MVINVLIRCNKNVINVLYNIWLCFFSLPLVICMNEMFQSKQFKTQLLVFCSYLCLLHVLVHYNLYLCVYIYIHIHICI